MFKNTALAVLNLIYPLRCAGCEMDLPYSEPGRICRACEESVREIPSPFCVKCGVHLPDGGERCFLCRRQQFSFEAVRSCSKFEGVLKDLIHQFKYGGKDYLGRDLVFLLTKGWRRYPEIQTAELVMPVPLHPAAFRERGYNQSEILARGFAEAAGLGYAQ